MNGKKSFRIRDVERPSKNNCPTLDEFDKGRRSFLERLGLSALGLGVLGSGLAACVGNRPLNPKPDGYSGPAGTAPMPDAKGDMGVDQQGISDGVPRAPDARADQQMWAGDPRMPDARADTQGPTGGVAPPPDARADQEPLYGDVAPPDARIDQSSPTLGKVAMPDARADDVGEPRQGGAPQPRGRGGSCPTK